MISKLTLVQSGNRDAVTPQSHPSVTGSRLRTLEAIFRHPSAHNLEWIDVVALISKIGEVDEKANNELAFFVSGKRLLMRKSHSKDLAGDELFELRKFLSQAGWSAKGPPQLSSDTAPAKLDLVVVIDHHGARIYDINVSSAEASQHEIKPYDPYEFLHHLAHRDQTREQGQRAPEDPAFYQQIAEALKAADRIVVVGHGIGKSNAAHHLVEHLRLHENAVYQRVVREVVADFSGATAQQLLLMARQALR